jgi:uncharacterized protein (DUF1778 family)
MINKDKSEKKHLADSLKDEQLLLSEEDCEIFFSEIANPRNPNEALRKAMNDYKTEFSE